MTTRRHVPLQKTRGRKWRRTSLYAGNGGITYGVAHGEEWRAGPHRLTCDDITNGGPLRTPHRPDVMITDPPHTKIAEAAYRARASAPPSPGFDNFIGHLADLAAGVRGSVFVELGESKEPGEELTRCMLARGGRLLNRWEIVYYKGRYVAIVYRFAFGPADDWREQPLSGIDDVDLAGRILRGYNGRRLVYDPCTGTGWTAWHAHNQGHLFAGTEISPFRSSAALTRLARCGLVVGKESERTTTWSAPAGSPSAPRGAEDSPPPAPG